MKRNSLFERLGGSAGINKLVDDIVGLHMENPVIRARLIGWVSFSGRI